MRPIGEVLSPLARRATALAETRRGTGIVFVAALAVWWLQALVIPLAQGRDFGTYLGAYAQLFQSDPIDLGYVLNRTPLSPLVLGGLLDVAGGALAEPAVSLLYAASITAWFLAARSFGALAALLTAVVLLAWPGYGILFHELSGDAVFAAAFAGWSLLAVRVLPSPTLGRFALLGAGVGALVLVRPGNQVLLVLALLPLALRRTWRIRLLTTLAFAAPAVAVLALWAVHNGVRHENYTVARGGNATVPFFRAFVTDKLVRPSNGEASRELAEAVQRQLLPKEPYRSYGITFDEFFTQASPRMQEDLVALSDRVKGWNSNHRWLRDVGVEAVRSQPVDYARGVASSTWGSLRQALYRPLSGGGASEGDDANGGDGSEETIVVAGRRLPKPTEGDSIPAPHEGGVATPDGSIYTVWTSPTEHHLVFVHPGDEARYRALHRRMDELARGLPDRSGNSTLALRLNQASRWFPPPAFWLGLGIVALALRRPKGALVFATPAVAALVVIVLSALGLPAEPHYSAPVAPAFILLGAGALFARRREPAVDEARARRTRLPSAASIRLVAGAALGVVALAWAVQTYSAQLDGVRAGQAPYDFDVYLRAASAVLDGDSPYVFRADQTFAYPPLLAFLVAPLEPLGAGAATAIWAVVSLAAIVGALLLLGVRDWRCHALALVYPVTQSTVHLGTVGPLLLLAVAVAWRWRDRVVTPAAAVGAAVALKLLLWPVAVWLALTRRSRAAVATAGFALAFAFVPWAAIGFSGLADYPGLLRRLADEEATASYSVMALGVRAHLPEVAAVVLSLLVTAVLLVAAARIARDKRRTPRDREVAALILALAAALAASPIVWVHYFLLLLVPLALTRPRLSPLWLVPFAYWPLGETAWPGGDARKLALALATTLVLLLVTTRSGAGDSTRTALSAGAARSMRALLGRASGSPSRQARPSP